MRLASESESSTSSRMANSSRALRRSLIPTGLLVCLASLLCSSSASAYVVGEVIFGNAAVTHSVSNYALITLTNDSTAVTGVQFGQSGSGLNLPPGVELASPDPVTTCTGGSLSFGSDVNGAYLRLSGVSMAANEVCTVEAYFRSNSAQVVTYTVDDLSWSGGGPEFFEASYESRLNLPGVLATFSPTSGSLTAETTLTYSFTNNDISIAEGLYPQTTDGLAFTMDFATSGARLRFVSSTPSTNTCGATIAVTSLRKLTVTGGTIPASVSGVRGTCEISMRVKPGGTTPWYGRWSSAYMLSGVTSSNAFTTDLPQASYDVYYGPPQVTKQFDTTPIVANQPTSYSTLTITLKNYYYNPAMEGVAFTDTYPSGLVNTTPAVFSTTCPAGTVTAADGDNKVSLAGGTIPKGSGTVDGQCTVSVRVVGTTAGLKTNTIPIGGVTSTLAGSNLAAATANVEVRLQQPSATSNFNSASVGTGETSLLTILISNPSGTNISGASFTSNYSTSTGFTNSSTPGAWTDCPGGTATAVASGSSVSLSGATIPTAGCSVTVQVIGRVSGTYYSHDSAGGFTISSTDAMPGTGTRGQLDVEGPDFRIVKRVTSLSGPCSAGSCQVTYTLSLDIISGTGYGTSFSVQDVLPSQLAYVSSSTSSGSISNSGGTITWTYSGSDFGIVPGAAAKTATITATVNTATQISNTAAITALEPQTDPVLSNNTDTTIFQASAISLTGLRAEVGGAGTAAIWETGAESGTAGYYLFRKTNEGDGYVSVGAKLIPGLIESPSGGTYRLGDPDAPRGVPLTYVLVELQTNGERISYGPFTVRPQSAEAFRSAAYEAEQEPMPVAGAQAEAQGVLSAFFDEGGNLVSQPGASGGQGRPVVAAAGALDRIPRGISAVRAERVEASKVEAETVVQRQNVLDLAVQGIGRADGSVGKLGVRGEGLRFASSQQIGTGLGLSVESVDALIAQGKLALSFMQSPVAWLAGDHGVYFYGEGADSLFTNDRVYLVAATAGTTMASAKSTGGSDKGTGAVAIFESVQHAEKDLVVNFGNPDAASDYWHWGYVLASNGAAASKTFELRTDGARNSGLASLKLKLYGGTDFPTNPDHPVEVRLNGVLVGEASWDGFGWYDLDLSVSSGLLQDGANSVELTARLAPETSLNLVYLDSIDVRYPRAFVATSDSLLFTVPAPGKKADTVVVSGFTTPDILVLNVSVPTVPIVVAGAQVTGGAGAYSVQFVPTGSGTQYLAVTKSAARAPDSIGAAQLGNALKSPGHRADYVVITASGLEGPAGSLASLRSKQGLEPLVVSVDEVMDTFNAGNYSPLAIRDFLAFATTSWAKGPRSVVLAGDASYDYRNNLGYGGNLVPTMMVGTPFGLAASDGSLAELDGDGVPDLAIGRLPVISASELQTVVDKLAAYDGSAGAGGRVVLSADSVSPTGVSNFSAESDSLALGLPSRLPPSRIYLDSLAVPAARTQLKADLAAGTGFLNFYGHSTPTKLAPGGLFTVQDVPSFAVGAQAPVVTAGTCFTNRFFDPTTDALGEVLAVQGGGYGAVGVFATSGYSLTYQATTLMEEFYRTVGAWRLRTLGEVTLQSLREFAKAGGAPFMTQTYGLLGDPATPLKNEKQ